MLLYYRIFHDVIAFLKQLEDQGPIQRYARQDDNRNRIEQFNKPLDEAILVFSVSFLVIPRADVLIQESKLLLLQVGLQIGRLTVFQLELRRKSGTARRGS
jgi:hypothetical protein